MRFVLMIPAFYRIFSRKCRKWLLTVPPRHFQFDITFPAGDAVEGWTQAGGSVSMRALGILSSLLSVVCSLVAAGCGASPQRSKFPPGYPVPLLHGPVHLGDNRAGSQNFPSGHASAARICSLVNLPSAADVHVQVVNVRNTETLGDVLTVNGRPFPLGITLERDPRGITPNATTSSPVFPVRLEKGPSEICLVSGLKLNGDVDDFEVDQVVLFVDDFEPDEVEVRRGLGLGSPPPAAPPSQPWGTGQ
jgi:hypothetical protein